LYKIHNELKMKNKYIYNVNEITAIYNESYYVWIAFKGNSNSCILKKVSALDPDIVYFTLTIEANEITAIFSDDDYIYLSLDSLTYFGMRLKKETPNLVYTYINIPIGITEEAIDLVTNNEFIYILTPGLDSGTTAKVCQFNKINLTLITIIDLMKSGLDIVDAKKIDIDNNGNVWVVSEVDPPRLTKLSYNGIWDIDTYLLT